MDFTDCRASWLERYRRCRGVLGLAYKPGCHTMATHVTCNLGINCKGYQAARGMNSQGDLLGLKDLEGFKLLRSVILKFVEDSRCRAAGLENGSY